jgi:hypothetical protein
MKTLWKSQRGFAINLINGALFNMNLDANYWILTKK